MSVNASSSSTLSRSFAACSYTQDEEQTQDEVLGDSTGLSPCEWTHEAAQLSSLLHKAGISTSDGQPLPRYSQLAIDALGMDAKRILLYRQLYHPFLIRPQNSSLAPFSASPLQWFSKILVLADREKVDYWDSLLTGSAVPLTASYQRDMMKRLPITDRRLQAALEKRMGAWTPAWSNLDYLLRITLKDMSYRDEFEETVLAALAAISPDGLSAKQIRSSCLRAHYRFGDSATVFSIGDDEHSMDLVLWYEKECLPELFVLNELMVSVHELLLNHRIQDLRIYPQTIRSSLWNVVFDRWQKIVRFNQPESSSEQWNEGLQKKLNVYRMRGYLTVDKQLDQTSMEVFFKSRTTPERVLSAVKNYAVDHCKSNPKAALAYTLQWMHTIQLRGMKEPSFSVVAHWTALVELLAEQSFSRQLKPIAAFVSRYPQHSGRLLATLKFGGWLAILAQKFTGAGGARLQVTSSRMDERPAMYLCFREGAGVMLPFGPQTVLEEFFAAIEELDRESQDALFAIVQLLFPFSDSYSRVASDRRNDHQVFGMSPKKLLLKLPGLITSQHKAIREAGLLLAGLARSYDDVYTEIFQPILAELPKTLAQARERRQRTAILSSVLKLLELMSGKTLVANRGQKAVVDGLVNPRLTPFENPVTSWELAVLQRLCKVKTPYVEGLRGAWYHKLWNNPGMNPTDRARLIEQVKALGLSVGDQRTELSKLIIAGRWTEAARLIHQHPSPKRPGLSVWQVFAGWQIAWRKESATEEELSLAAELLVRYGEKMHGAIHRRDSNPANTWQGLVERLLQRLVKQDAKGRCSPTKVGLALQIYEALPTQLSQLGDKAWEQRLIEAQVRALPCVFSTPPRLEPKVMDQLRIIDDFLKQKRTRQASDLALRIAPGQELAAEERKRLLIFHFLLFDRSLGSGNLTAAAKHRRVWKQMVRSDEEKFVGPSLTQRLFEARLQQRRFAEAEQMLGKVMTAGAEPWLLLLQAQFRCREPLRALATLTKSPNKRELFRATEAYASYLDQMLAALNSRGRLTKGMARTLWAEVRWAERVDSLRSPVWLKLISVLKDKEAYSDLWDILGLYCQSRHKERYKGTVYNAMEVLLKESLKPSAPMALKDARTRNLGKVLKTCKDAIVTDRGMGEIRILLIENMQELYLTKYDDTDKLRRIDDLELAWGMFPPEKLSRGQQGRVDAVGRFILEEKLRLMPVRYGVVQPLRERVGVIASDTMQFLVDTKLVIVLALVAGVIMAETVCAVQKLITCQLEKM